jgi:hypothetical protein
MVLNGSCVVPAPGAEALNECDYRGVHSGNARYYAFSTGLG